MKLGIMQPYFFPYLGYFDLINYSDHWIVFDTVQYIRHGWINRNRILHPFEGWSYIIVPVKFSRETAIRDVQIVKDEKWKKRILGQLQHYKKRAPFYYDVLRLVEEILSVDIGLISNLNVYALELICSYLNINFNYTFFSAMDLDLGEIQKPGHWALRISEAVGANEYVNPPSGEPIFDRDEFSSRRIKLTIRNMPPLQYDCPGYNFMPSLSILDVLMWNSPLAVKKYLEDQKDLITSGKE
jgi:hypothetical protein